MDDLDDALARAEAEPIVLYKHSATCSLSARMQQEMTTLDGADDPPVYRIVVQEARAVSDAIAEQFGIRHESPQAIVVYDGVARYDASHTGIAPNDIRTASTQVAHA